MSKPRIAKTHPVGCKICKGDITKPQHVYLGWCETCQIFQYEIAQRNHRGEVERLETIQLDSIIADMHRKHRDGDQRISVLFEMYTSKEGGLAWRAVFMVDGKPKEHSRRDQACPTDALRELALLVGGVPPWEI